MERNELCWCGSGKKYKKCHMPIEEKIMMHAERGEIVPTLFIGATFGTFFATVTGCYIPLFAAVGMGAVFCGVTNSPITSLLICFELFGFEGMPYFLIAIALSYMLSGYYGLYSSQKIIYSKYKTEYINRKTH